MASLICILVLAYDSRARAREHMQVKQPQKIFFFD